MEFKKKTEKFSGAVIRQFKFHFWDAFQVHVSCRIKRYGYLCVQTTKCVFHFS